MTFSTTPRRVVLMALAAAITVVALAPGSAIAKKKKPNIVFVFNDDQSVDTVRSYKNLPKFKSPCKAPRGTVQPCLNQLIRGHGVNFSRMADAYPLCCPSRATLITGQFGHNNGVRSLFQYENMQKTEVLPIWLQRAGYRTGWIGKYQGPSYLGKNEPGEQARGYPNGFDDFQGLVDENALAPKPTDIGASANAFYGYTVNHNGVHTTMPKTPQYYQTDWITRQTTKFIKTSSKGSKPFFIGVGYTAPHWSPKGAPNTDPTDMTTKEGNPTFESNQNPPVVAPRHQDELKKFLAAHIKVPRTPNFSEKDLSDKPAFVQKAGQVSPETAARLDKWQAYRLASLLAVDEGVQKIYKQLKKSKQLNNTYIVYGGDNGWMQGNHGLTFTKTHVYEESTRVPFFIRGPHTKKATVSEPTSNVDWASTFLSIAGGKPGVKQDGMSLTPYLKKPAKRFGRAIFYETTDAANPLSGVPGYNAIKLGRWKYVEYTSGEKELYDLQKDPYELNSLHANLQYAGVIAALHARLVVFDHCAGQSGPNACLVRHVEAPAAP
jgi:arylsulfatase A-like enzyme